MGKTIKSLLLPEKLSALVFNLAVLFFIIAFNFSDNPRQSGWFQQFLPSIGGRQISDIFFIDSLQGYATAYTTTDTNYVLKTSNSGDNWTIVYRDYALFNRVQFLNQNIGYVCGAILVKTTNGGGSWFIVNTSGIVPENMHVLNEDTIWITYRNSLVGGVFRTTNGGVNWVRQLNLGSLNPTNIYFFDGNTGFISMNTAAPYVRKTTNNGLNWSVIVNNEGFVDMFFLDSLIGWKAYDSVKKTIDGGFNWTTQVIPYGGYIYSFSQLIKFANVNRDTMWGVGGRIAYPNNQSRGIIYKTTNGGNNWGFQLPDTSINIFRYVYIQFVNKLNGWAYGGSTGVHTTTGGDTTWYFGIQQTGTEVPEEFVLGQNYPNPFNPRTVIPFSLKKRARVRLIAYDIRGREVQTMVDSELSAGEYEVDFMGKFTSSGVYLYRLEVSDDRSKQLFTQTRKMILLK